jgi:predicted acyltransferase
MVVLFVLGLVYNGLFRLQLDTLRLPSVLGRIGLTWGIAALLCVWLRPKARAAIAVALLVGYSLLMMIPAPDVAEGVGALTKESNLAGYVDRIIMPNHIYWRGIMDPEGLLSTLPAVVTALLGIFTGEWILREGVSGGRKALIMAAASVVMLTLGLVWNHWQPINKMLWSSAFVLTAGAYSLALFALFYYVIDVRGCRRWAEWLRVIGVNSITIYLLQEIVSFSGISQFFLGGLAAHLTAELGAVVLSAGYIVACWLVLYLLDKHNIHLKV